MSMNSIVDGMASSTLPAFKSAVQLKAPLKDAVDVVVPPKVRNGSTMGHDAAKVSAPVSVADKIPVREMCRVSESYDARGTVITKYTDSSNNVIYQTPSESVLRTQELMSKTQAATSIKA